MQDVQPEEHESAELQLEDTEMVDVPLNGHGLNKLQSPSSSTDYFEDYRSCLEHPESQPTSSSSNSPDYHHPDMRHLDPLSSSSSDSTPHHPDLDHLDTQYTSSSSGELSPLHSLLRIETLAQKVLHEMHEKEMKVINYGE